LKQVLPVEASLSSVRWRNTSLSILDYSDGWRMVSLCDASHLDGLEEGATNPPITDSGEISA
jgi:hypothetical protein